MNAWNFRTGNECCAAPQYNEEDVCRSCGNRNVKSKNVSVRVEEKRKDALVKECSEEGITVSDAVRIFLERRCKQLMAEPESEFINKTKSIGLKISPELSDLLTRAQRHSGQNIVTILEPLFAHADAGYLHPMARPKRSYDPNVDCCENENRDHNGGCRSCGDPCL